MTFSTDGEKYAELDPGDIRYRPKPDRSIVRLGYSGFLSAVWMMWKMNRASRAFDIKTKAEIIFPLRWLR